MRRSSIAPKVITATTVLLCRRDWPGIGMARIAYRRRFSAACRLCCVGAWLLLTAAPSIAKEEANSVVAELVGENVISTPDDEFGSAISADGASLYFTKRSPTTNTSPRSFICVSRRRGADWGEPQIASFSGRYNDFGAALSRDGRHLFFASDRPIDAAQPQVPGNIHIWTTELEHGAWATPKSLGAPVNGEAIDANPSLAADGTLYFASNRAGGKGGFDLYRARWLDGKYAEPENLAAINSAAYESQPAIAPDQSFIVFTSIGRDDALTGSGAPYPRADLYVSFNHDGNWTPPRHLAPPINSPASDSNPALSPDGRWLYFSSERGFAEIPMPQRMSAREFETRLHSVRNGWNNIYRVPIEAIHAIGNAVDGAVQP